VECGLLSRLPYAVTPRNVSHAIWRGLGRHVLVAVSFAKKTDVSLAGSVCQRLSWSLSLIETGPGTGPGMSLNSDIQPRPISSYDDDHVIIDWGKAIVSSDDQTASSCPSVCVTHVLNGTQGVSFSGV